MKVKVYKLTFPSGVHFGLGRSGYDRSEDFLHSDTLAGAIAVALSKLKGKDGNEIFRTSSFSISSAFPFSGERLFLPKPQEKIFEDDVIQRYSKHIKKIKWIEMSLFEKVRRGELLREEEVNIESGGKFLVGKGEIANEVYKTFKFQRVTINRLNSESEPFIFQELRFAEGAGLFFFANFQSPDVEKEFDTALSFLADEGIGSDRTVGKGWFRCKKYEMEIEEIESEKIVLLSLYIPTEEELNRIDLEASKFALIKRGGWVTNGNLSLRKNSVWTFAEGSVFSVKGKIEGKNPVVLQSDFSLGLDFDVYRWGKAFCLGWRKK